MPPRNESKIGQPAAEVDVDKDGPFADLHEAERWEKQEGELRDFIDGADCKSDEMMQFLEFFNAKIPEEILVFDTPFKFKGPR